MGLKKGSNMTAIRTADGQGSLYLELSQSPSVLGKRVDFLYSFLSAQGITSLSEVSDRTLKEFLLAVRRQFAFAPGKYSAYKGDLETVLFSYMKRTGHPLSRLSPWADGPRGRKSLVFLYASGISSPKEITAKDRKAYEDYLSISVPTKLTEYLKAFDNIVLNEIEKNPFARTPAYENTLFFIGYYPDIKVAKRLYYTAGKKYLYFDFSLPAASTLKKQIFRILVNDVNHIDMITNHYLIQHFITPLHYLYDYCVKEGISDLKQFTDKEVAGFHDYLDANLEATIKTAPQVLYRARKYLFISDKKPDFTATCWFLERFSLSNRMNPARVIERFYFGDISAEHRVYFQHYMKYLLVLSPKYSLHFLNEKYYYAKEFIKYLENRHSSLMELSYSDIQGFIEYRESMDRAPETFNRELTMLSFFLTVISVREKLLIPSFPFEYFYKKDIYLHHDRSVPEDTVNRIFTVLSDFPETLGLMFLTLYSTGLRINEVCSLKKDALFTDKGTDWLRVYQYKMHSDKEIPIPEEVSRLLKRYISTDTSGSQYIFHSCKNADRPYMAGTFTKQMKAQLLLYEQTKDIVFRSHDYRHTIATDLHMSGASLGTTRAYLGHTRDDMTKQYIDHLPGRIDMLQDKYFKENDPS